jgi:hypothetical protein
MPKLKIQINDEMKKEYPFLRKVSNDHVESQFKYYSIGLRFQIDIKNCLTKVWCCKNKLQSY